MSAAAGTQRQARVLGARLMARGLVAGGRVGAGLMVGALASLGGCAVPEVPLPVEGRIEVLAPPEVPASVPRVAMLWTSPTAVAVLDDQPLMEGAAFLTLRPPPPEVLLDFRPVEMLEFVTPEGFRFATAEVLRPRLAMYEDVNRNGRLDLPPPHGDGADVLLALDRGAADGLAWLPDLTAVFAQTYIRFNDQLDRLLGGAHSPWVRVTGTGPLLARDPAPPYLLGAGEPALLETLLLCPRFEVGGANRIDERLLVDPQAPGRLKCDPDCRDPAFRAVAAEATSFTEALPLREECQRGERLWAWRQRQEGVVCSNCVCEFIEFDVIAVTDPDDPPAWWPCQAPPGAPGAAEGVPECETCALLCELDACPDAPAP